MSIKLTQYNEHELRALKQASVFTQFLTQKGLVEDQSIENEAMRKAKQSAAIKAYHNTKIFLELYRTIIWVLECVPGELAAELGVQTKNIDALLEKMDIEMARENKRLESRLNTAIKTRVMLDRLQEALMVLRKKPGNGEKLYRLIYDAYLDPTERATFELIERMHVATRTYYKLRAEATTIISTRLWGGPNREIDEWIEILTMMQDI